MGHELRLRVIVGMGVALLATVVLAHGQDRLPGGGVAQASGQGAVRAWYGQPNRRYDHGILGDAIEGGSLVVVGADGHQHELVLPERYVFEDITPRLADLDGDGTNEIITIRTDVTAGAAVAVYRLEQGRLHEIAATDPLGRPHRWLSIAAIADLTGDGHAEIAIVKTPHIGGVLEVLSLRGGRLVSLYEPQPGYATHFIGSPILSLAAVGDVSGDGALELALPEQSRRGLWVLRFGKTITTVFTQELPAAIVEPIEILGTGRLRVRLETGATKVVRLP